MAYEQVTWHTTDFDFEFIFNWSDGKATFSYYCFSVDVRRKWWTGHAHKLQWEQVLNSHKRSTVRDTSDLEV